MKHALLVIAVTVSIAPIAAAGATGPDHDTIIRNGLVYDGSGAVPYVGDVCSSRDDYQKSVKDRKSRGVNRREKLTSNWSELHAGSHAGL